MLLPNPSLRFEQDEFLRSLALKSSSGPLRGDYARIDSGYQIDQRWESYTPEQHALWRRLYQRQAGLLQGRACDAFIQGLERLNAGEAIPRFDSASLALSRASGWSLKPVPGLIPDGAFFASLAARQFPVTVWLRSESEFDYIVEPDIFHDFFGHVPLLFDPVFAEFMRSLGEAGCQALRLNDSARSEALSRLYWRTIEFGLIQSACGARVYGAGILSSGSELAYSLSNQAQRLAFDPEQMIKTPYQIDSFQSSYWIIQGFEQLYSLSEGWQIERSLND